MKKLTCTACGYWVSDEDEQVTNTALVAHQAQCSKIDPEKREFRLAILSLMIGAENVDAAIEIMTGT